MRKSVFDSSAALALLFGETGSEQVLRHLVGAVMTSLCYSEVLGRAMMICGSFTEAKLRVDRMRMNVVAFDEHQAALAATIRPATQPQGISLADRSCLVLGMDRQLPIITADQKWKLLDLPVELIYFR
jgi:ribonuclease VapC